MASFRARILASMGVLPLALGACGVEDPEVDGAPVEAADGADLDRVSGTTPTLVLDADTNEAIRLATFIVTGAQPGATVHVVYGTSIAPRCPPSLGGACIDAATPATELGVAVADA